MAKKHTNGIIGKALKEDSASHDITTNILVPKDHKTKAVIVFKENGIICGLNVVKQVFRRLDKNIKFQTRFKDGQRVKKGARVISMTGRTRSLLAGERVALNFLSYLSGIATRTGDFVQKTKPYKTKILDTRKTTPGLRNLEKYAVRCGGGTNHRANLQEMVLIKDNHRAACLHLKSLEDLIRNAKKSTKKNIEVEIDTLKEFNEVLKAKPHIILLDNMNTSQIKKAVAIIKKLKKRPQLEASGGIRLNNVRRIARTGVDRISIGELTHSVKAINVSMELVS